MSNSISRAAVHAVEWSFKVPHSEIFAAEGLNSWKRNAINNTHPDSGRIIMARLSKMSTSS